MSLDVGQFVNGFVNATLLRKPPWAFRDKWDANHEEGARDVLDAPGCAEAGRTLDETAAVTDEVHYQNSPLYGELLDDDDGAAFLVLADFREVDRHLRRGDANTDAIEEATGNKHTPACAANLNAGSREPPEA